MKIKKRSGQITNFDCKKIESAIKNAFKSCKTEYDKAVYVDAIYTINKQYNNCECVDIEDIQDLVEGALMRSRYHHVAKSYMLYREQHKNTRFIRERLDYMKQYSSTRNNAATASETDANANVSIKNVANMEGEVYKTNNRDIQRQRMKDQLNIMFPDVAKQYLSDLEHHIIYTNDEASTPALKKYCAAVSLYPLMTEGIGNLDNVTPSAPSDISSFSGQLVNSVFLLSSQAKGAIALGEYFIALNYYIIAEFGPKWYDKLDCITTSEHCLQHKTIRKSIYKGFKQFVWGVNQPQNNRGYQSPFTNISYYDKTYFDSLFGEFRYPDGTQAEWKAIDTLQRLFIKWFNELRTKQIVTFPVETFAMVHDGQDIVDKEYKDLCAEMYAEGHSFFTYISDSADSLASCCFSGDTFISYIMDNCLYFTTFKEMYQLAEEKQIDTIRIKYKDSYVKAKPVRLKGRTMYNITCGGHTYCMTDNHINVTEKGLERTDHLTIDDKLLHYLKYKDVYVPIQNIEKVENQEYVYCVECIDSSNPYFELPTGLITHNCRLCNELAENTFSPTSGLTGVMTGSCNVITLNINRIVQDWACTKPYFGKPFVKGTKLEVGNSLKVKSLGDDFKKYLIDILERVYKYHIAFKTMLYETEEQGMFSDSNAGYIYINKLYSTIGLNGLNEAARFLGLQVGNNKDYIDFLQLVLGTVKEQNKIHSIHDKKRPFLFNSEVIPAESLGGKNYQWDKEDGYWVPDDENLYNSYFYNAHDNTSVLDKFILHGKQTYQFTDGGSAAHINLSEHLSKEQYLKLIDFAIKNGTNYFTFNIPNSKCEDCGHIVKKPINTCPKCGGKHITQYTRVIGYLRPVTSFSKDRQIEASKRVYNNGKSELC